MPQSLCKINLHIIFHIKTTSPTIQDEHIERLHEYIGQLVNSTGCRVIRVGGMADHVHIICILSRNETVAHLVEEVKRNSSLWIKTVAEKYQQFAWQGGYAAFAVSESVLPNVVAYVCNQKEHHKRNHSEKSTYNYYNYIMWSMTRNISSQTDGRAFAPTGRMTPIAYTQGVALGYMFTAPAGRLYLFTTTPNAIGRYTLQNDCIQLHNIK